MANLKATGKKCVFGEKAQNKTFKLYSWEVEKVRQFIKELRAKEKQKMAGY